MSASLEEEGLCAALANNEWREVLRLADVALTSRDRISRSRMHYFRLVAIERGGLGEVDLRTKEALATHSSPSDAIDVRLALGRVSLLRGDFETALRMGTTMKSLLAAVDKKRRAAALALEGAAKWSAGQLTDAAAAYGAAAALLKEDGDAEGEALALNNRGRVRVYVGDLQGALLDHERALAILAQAAAGPDTDRAKAEIENALGFALWNLGRHDQALVSLSSALAARQRTRDIDGEAVTHNNIGNVHRVCGRTEMARVAYTQAVGSSRQSGNRLAQAIALNNLGQMAMDAEDFGTAKIQLDTALALAQTIGDRIREADNFASLGTCALLSGNATGAVDSLTRAVALRRQTQDVAYLVLDLSALAAAFASLGDTESAREMIAEVEETLSTGQKGVELLQNVYFYAYEVGRAIGDDTAAHSALTRAATELARQVKALSNQEARAALLRATHVNRQLLLLVPEAL